MESSKEKTVRECTTRQALALEYWRKDKFRSKARALRKAGYSEAVARQPHKVFGSPAIKSELFFLGIGDRVSKYWKEQGRGAQALEVELEKAEDEVAKVDRAIRQITPEQILILRQRLIEEAGYDPRPKIVEPEVQYSGSTGSNSFEVISRPRIPESIASFSSM